MDGSVWVPQHAAPQSHMHSGHIKGSSVPVLLSANSSSRRLGQGMSTKGFVPSTALIGGGFVPASSSNGHAMNQSSPPMPEQCPILVNPPPWVPSLMNTSHMKRDNDGASVSTYLCDSNQGTPFTSPSASPRSKTHPILTSAFACSPSGDQYSNFSTRASDNSYQSEMYYRTSQYRLEEPAHIESIPQQSLNTQQSNPTPAPTNAFNPRHVPFAPVVDYTQNCENVTERPISYYNDSFPSLDINQFLQSTLTRCPPDSTQMPFGIIAQPFAAHLPAPSVHYARCDKCKGYMNSHIEFQDCFRNWKCSLCGTMNKVSDDMATEGQFVRNRPDILYSSVDYFGPKMHPDAPSYLREPRYLFLLDISAEAVQSGSLAAACRGIQASLDHLNQYEALKLGIMTYDTTVHFYDLSGRWPRMIVLPDLEDLYEVDACPFFLPVAACRTALDVLLEKLPTMKIEQCVSSSDFYSALSAVNMVLKVTGGKVFALTVTPPILKGSSKNANDSHTQREARRNLKPGSQAIEEIGELLAKNQIACEIFAANDKFQDLASLRAVCLNGGVVRKYKISDHELHGFEHDIRSAATLIHAFDVSFRVRASQGWKVDLQFALNSDDPCEISGLCKSTELVPVLSENSTIAFSLQPKTCRKLYRDKLIVQLACVYVNMHGERRIRTHTQEYKVEMDFGVVNPSAMLMLVNNKAMRESQRTNNLETGKKMIVETLQDVSRRVKADAPKEWEIVSRLLYGMLQSDAFNSSTPNVDDNLRIWERLRECPIVATITLAFPRLWRLSDISEYGADISSMMPLTCRQMSNSESYLLFDGQKWLLWIGCDAEGTQGPEGDHQVPYSVCSFLTSNGTQEFPAATFTMFRSRNTFMR